MLSCQRSLLPLPAGKKLSNVSRTDVTIITRADIEKKGVTFIADLLRLQPDLQVVQNGGPGMQATLRMRGGGSSQVLVMVDGLKLNSPSTGQADPVRVG